MLREIFQKNNTPEKIQTFPDILPFDKAIFNSFIEEFVLDDDKAEYKTNFGITLSSSGNRRTLSNCLGFRKAEADGTLVFVDAVYKVGESGVKVVGK